METNSYFKVSSEQSPELYFYFDKALIDTVKTAYEAAKKYADEIFDGLPSDMKIGRPSYSMISIWQKPYFPGPWEVLAIIGITKGYKELYSN
jgi:hypothetical protein